MLLVGQHRYALDAYSWEIPEGGVPDGESALDGARRELREETGVEADDVARARPGPPLELGLRRARRALPGHRAHATATATPEPTEALEVRWLPFEEVLAMTLDGRITDAMTVVAVERLALIRSRAATRRLSAADGSDASRLGRHRRRARAGSGRAPPTG